MMLFTLLPDAVLHASDRKTLFDSNWKFHLGIVANAEQPEYNDSHWRVLDLPHDWSVEPLSFQKQGITTGPFSRMSEGDIDTGQTVGGEGWYRKELTLAGSDADKRIVLYFEGVYNQSELWINGKKANYNVYGYTSYRVDITPYLNAPGTPNVIATNDISQSKNAMFKLMGDKFCHLHEEFVRQGNYSFSLPSDLQEHFIEYLSQVNEECCDEVDNKMQGVVRRMGLIAYRIMMVLTAVRHLENMPHESSSSDKTIQLICHKYDYSIAMSICETLLCHAVFIYRNLSGNQPKRLQSLSQETGIYARRNTLYNMLPETFTKKDYDATVLALGENGSTANKWIEAFIKDGKLSRIEQGKYRKIF